MEIGLLCGSNLLGNQWTWLAGHKQKVLKGKETGIQMYEVFDKGKTFRLADRELYELNGCCVFCLTILKSLAAILLIGQN